MVAGWKLKDLDIALPLKTRCLLLSLPFSICFTCYLEKIIVLVRSNLAVLVFQIVRFKDKETHQIFLEPEGRTVPELYVQVSFIYQVMFVH